MDQFSFKIFINFLSQKVDVNFNSIVGRLELVFQTSSEIYCLESVLPLALANKTNNWNSFTVKLISSPERKTLLSSG
jgi:hypothetical protein